MSAPSTLGRIGFERRVDYSAVGSGTNRASRLCDAAKAGQIIVTAEVLDEIRQRMVARTQALEARGIPRCRGRLGDHGTGALAGRRIDTARRTPRSSVARRDERASRGENRRPELFVEHASAGGRQMHAVHEGEFALPRENRAHLSIA